MKSMKKLLSLVLAMMLVLAMGSTAMASQPTSGNNQDQKGELTVENAIPGQTYTIYKILDLESYNSTNGAYLYKVADGWNDFVTGEVGSQYLTVDGDGYVTWKTGVPEENAAEFAKAALAYAEGKTLAVKTATAPAAPEGSSADAIVTVEFTDLDLGYYLLDSTTGALCSLDTTNPNQTISEKNEKPTVEKEVEQPSASIGDVLDYVIKVKIAAGAENYVIHDKMSGGLTFNGEDTIQVKVLSKETVDALDPDDKDAVKNAAGIGGFVAPEDYTITSGKTLDHDDTFDITITEAGEAKLPVGGMIVVTYKATINADALEFDEVNNKATLDYGDENHTTSTETPDVPTKFIDVNILKFAKINSEETGLDGAEFTLSKNEDGTDPISFVDLTNGNYRVATEEDENTTTTVVSPAGTDIGKINLDGLGAGTYYLTETKAPDGYNLLKAPVKIIITETTDATTGETTLTVQIPELNDDGSVKEDADGNEVLMSTDQVKVQNMTGAELPSTGGIGTTIFYVLGGILVVGAGILLVVKKRMSSEK